MRIEKPKCVAHIEYNIDCDHIGDCENCERKDMAQCYTLVYSDDKIAALVSALKELGVEVVEKKLFDTMTREASKYQRLYDALLTMCAEQEFVPTLPKPKE